MQQTLPVILALHHHREPQTPDQHTGYKQDFHRLFGFGLDEVDYDAGESGRNSTWSRVVTSTDRTVTLFLQQTQPVAPRFIIRDHLFPRTNPLGLRCRISRRHRRGTKVMPIP